MVTAGWLMLPTHAMAEKGLRMNTTRAMMNWPAPSWSPTRKPGCVTNCFSFCIMKLTVINNQHHRHLRHGILTLFSFLAI